MNAAFAIAPVRPDPAMATRFFRALFPAGSCLHFRAVPEPKDTRTPTNHHYLMDERFDETVAQFLEYCFVESRAAFFLPAIARLGKTHKDAVETFTCVCADFDRGDAAAHFARAETELGPADIVVESGGTTQYGQKLHAYWKLAAPTKDIETVCALRHAIALRYDADPCMKQEAQVIRIPGSVHFKNGPKLVRLARCP